MVITKTEKIIGTLVLILLASGIVYISMDSVRMRVDYDKSTFYIKLLDENNQPSGRWLVSGREYNKLYDGSKLKQTELDDALFLRMRINAVLKDTPKP